MVKHSRAVCPTCEDEKRGDELTRELDALAGEYDVIHGFDGAMIAIKAGTIELYELVAEAVLAGVDILNDAERHAFVAGARAGRLGVSPEARAIAAEMKKKRGTAT